MRLRYWILILLVIAAVAAVLLMGRAKPVPVLVKPVEKGLVENTVANTRAGTVEACLRAKLSPSTGGQIAQLEVREGDSVKKGQLLVELWNEDLAAQVKLAESESKASESTAEAVCLQADVAQREADRIKKLKETGAASTEQIDKVVTVAYAKAADCIAAQASIEVSAMTVAVAKAQLAKTRLTAPFDGVIAEINGELNEYVTPSPPGIQTLPVVDLIDNSCFYVSAPIDEVDVAAVEPGLPARLTLDAFGKREFAGVVRRISPYVQDREKQARTVDVEVEFDDPEAVGRILAGYSADVEIILEVREETLRVPTEALIEDARVYVLNESTALLEERSVEIGMANWDFTEVLSGVSEGELVVTSVDRAGVEAGATARRE